MNDSPRRTLRCPHCGAPLPPESLSGPSTCAFCGITSAPEAPSAAPAMEASELGCPRCGCALFEGRAGAVALMGCGRCVGIWLDNDSAQSALATADEGVAQMASRASTNALVEVNLAAPVGCPVCKRVLQRVTEPKSEVRVDVCGAHGTWFDRYELGLVLQAAHPRRSPPTSYGGATPHFREGANPEIREAASVFATGAVSLAAIAGLALSEFGGGERR